MTTTKPAWITLSVDGREVEVAAGQTILDAARRVGVEIPTLCHLERCGPMTSCLVCVVKVTEAGRSRIVPSCGARAESGMVVESETAEVHELRRSALELLFSEHVGDCLSPCTRICPLDLNVPRMIRQIEADRPEAAIRTVRQALALPAVLSRLCHSPCENGCRRVNAGGSAAIRDLERFVADHDLDGAVRYLPARKPRTGKRIAIVGSGPTGLAAAYYLLCEGHDVTVVDRRAEAGGSLRDVAEDRLPGTVLDAEIGVIEQLGAEFRLNTELGRDVEVDELGRRFHAVLLAPGDGAVEQGDALGIRCTATGLKTDPTTSQTERANVFAAGSAVKPLKQLVRAMSEGKEAAIHVHQFLAGETIRGRARPFSSVMGRINDLELALFIKNASPASRTIPSAGPGAMFAPAEARQEAGRCLHCDCRAAGSCRLQEYAEAYGANPSRFPRQRRSFEQQLHPAGVVFEPGKCILCGICVRIAQQGGEPLGLTFVGRGFNVRVAAPLNRAFADGLQKVAAECVEHCPTGAISFRTEVL
jgi:ferredoxin